MIQLKDLFYIMIKRTTYMKNLIIYMLVKPNIIWI